jgi:catechol 2,3-dioxygenase-like lactoylglutathione lyase family enzyme
VSETRDGRITGIRTVGIPVSDQDRAREFYVGTLGLEARLDVAWGGGRRWIEVGAPEAPTTGVPTTVAPTTLALVSASDNAPSGVETGVRLSTSDADTTHAHMRAAGVDVDEVLRWPGVPPMFAFRDQDGNGLEVVEDTAARP